MKTSQSKNVDEYIEEAPEHLRERLVKMRYHIQKAAPDAQESISYMMPAYKYHGALVYFGWHNKHIGFYGAGSAMEGIEDIVSPYRTSKGTMQFSHDAPIPYDVVEKVVLYRVKENLARKAAKEKN